MIKNKFLSRLFLASLLASFFVFASAAKVFANIQITEIMYDLPGTDTGREWIEIYNPDSLPVDLTKIKLREADTNHGIATSSGLALLNPSSYAVIADVPSKFLIDNPSFNGLLFDSTFSLSNTGEPLELRNASGTTLDLITYDSSVGASGDGNSLQKINSLWVSSIPTPGAENIFLDTSTTTATTTDNSSNSTTTSTSTSDTSTTSDQTSDMGSQNTQTTRSSTRTIYISTHSAEEDLSDYNEKQIFETSAGRQRIAFVGAPISFTSNYKLPKNADGNSCQFSWSFGDGFADSGKKVVHTYKYQGEYSVILNSTCADKNAISRTTVKVIMPSLSMNILENGDIEIINNDKTEINIGGWNIKSGLETFTFPQDTIINPLKKITLSKEDTNIEPENNRVTLDNPSHREVIAIDNRHDVAISGDGKKFAEENLGMTIENAEALAELYRASPPAHISLANASAPLNTQNENISEEDAPQAASVLEASTTIQAGFWKRLFRLPVDGVKAIFRLFYNF